MSLSVLPYALGAAGLLQSSDSARRARNQANDANRMAEGEAQRRARIQATVEEMINSSKQYAEGEGYRRAEKNRERFARDSAQMQESTAGAYRIAGYRPGDTVTGDAIARVGRERENTWDQVVDSYIAEAKANRMGEAGAIAQSAGITGPNQEFYANQAANYRQQANQASQGVMGSLQTIMDAFPKPEKGTPPFNPSPAQPEQPGQPSPLATYDVKQENPYKGFDSLNVSDLFPKRKKNPPFANTLF